MTLTGFSQHHDFGWGGSRMFTNLASQIILILVVTLPPFIFSLWMMFRAVREYRSRMCRRQGRTTVGFFHPYCNAGGGGERVLWCAIRALQTKYPHVDCIVYTGDVDATEEQILQRASDRLGVEPIREVEFIFLNTRHWVEASRYPYFTLLGQSLGSLVLGWDALRKFVPDIYIDSMGYAFTLPLFKYFGGCKVSAYVHYPTISTDMLSKVERREAAHNNASTVARSKTLSKMKLIYYKIFAYLYGCAGRCSDVVMVNSSWTKNHVADIWCCPQLYVVFPPCDVEEFAKIPLETPKQKHIVSIGQFRPEKDHMLQLRSFNKFYSSLSPNERGDYKLVLVGGCRNEGDRQRVEELRALAREIGIEGAVEFCLNVPFSTLKEQLAKSAIGIHTMWNEHFGIGVVEIMAAGTIVLAHDSGGPKLDIVNTDVESRTGYLASDIDSFSSSMSDIFKLSDEQRGAITSRARHSMDRFSEAEFDRTFLEATTVLLQLSMTSH